jgi:RNA polymerase sigma factor (TIGR02999 family)
MSSMSEVSRILSALDAGDPHAAEQLLPLVYDELRKLAGAQMAGERPGQTLDATALVHEAYLRLVASSGASARRDPASGAASARRDPHWDSRSHFFAAAAQAMRRILVENARRKGRLKRGGGRERQAVELDALAAELPDEELLALHDALERFAAHDPVKAKLVELRFFGSMSLPDVARHLGISLSTAERGWRYARAWLYAALASEEKSAPS